MTYGNGTPLVMLCASGRRKGEVVKQPFPIEVIVYVSDLGGRPVYHVSEGGVAGLPVDLDGSEVGIYRLTRTVSFEVEKRFKS
jgi:hypothetical protein